MDDGALGAAAGLEGALDQFGPALRQHLDGDVVRDHLLLDQLAHELEIGLRRRREADLDFLVAHLDEELEHPRLAVGVHGFDQRLVAVAQVDRAPDRRLGDDDAGPLAVLDVDRLERNVFLGRGRHHRFLDGHLKLLAPLPAKKALAIYCDGTGLAATCEGRETDDNATRRAPVWGGGSADKSKRRQSQHVGANFPDLGARVNREDWAVPEILPSATAG